MLEKAVSKEKKIAQLTTEVQEIKVAFLAKNFPLDSCVQAEQNSGSKQ